MTARAHLWLRLVALLWIAIVALLPRARETAATTAGRETQVTSGIAALVDVIDGVRAGAEPVVEDAREAQALRDTRLSTNR